MSTPDSQRLTLALEACGELLGEAIREVGVSGLIRLYDNSPRLMADVDKVLSASLRHSAIKEVQRHG